MTATTGTLAALIDQGVVLLTRYRVERRTERLLDLAPIVVELRARHTLADGRIDWGGRSPGYREAMGTLYARAGVTSDERDGMQSALRYHVHEILHQRLDRDELAAAGLVSESPRQRLSGRRTQLVNATRHLVDVFDHYLADDIATRLNCVETEALAGLMEAVGNTAAAQAWRRAHAADDDPGDQHWNLHPDFDPDDHPFCEADHGCCAWCDHPEDDPRHHRDTQEGTDR